MKKSNATRNIRLIAAVVAIVLLVNIGLEVYSTIKTKYDISVAQKENTQLKEEAENLKNEVAKLKDESYIQSYVSGTIFSTEKGTTIYVLPEDETPE
ncbi:septum formation initiator family protein [Erysipelotrichaceae bacterium OttesenSCG-928-M19]|nr:septum formation initiator family protein [Erysipelotrichaceae bacterium OttesenSCG-928-M19]